MNQNRDSAIDFYMANPETELSALEVANMFGLYLNDTSYHRSKKTRDLKRSALNRLRKGEILTTSKYQVLNQKIDNIVLGTYDENLEKGTLEVSKITSERPRSADEIIKIHNIDTNLWKLVQYWSKEKASGWLVSAFFVSKKTSELSSDDILSAVEEVFTRIKVKPSITFKKTLTNKKALFVYMSDKHVGAATNSTAIYSNNYDASEFEKRMLLTLEEIKNQVNMFGKFEDIFICDLGDSLDGWNSLTTRGGHTLPQNMTNKEAFMTYLYVHKNFFDELIKGDYANNFNAIMQTNDNHCSSFGYITNQALALYLNTAYPFVEVTIMEKFIEHFDYGKHTFIFTHGKDSEDLKHGLPLFLNDKTENYLNKYISYHGLDTDKNISIVKGDLHTEAHQQSYKFRYRNVLSMYGSSKWIMNNFGPGFPGVSFDIVEKNTELIYSFYIRFNKN